MSASLDGILQRVPIYAQLHELAWSEMGILASEFYTTPEKMVYGAWEVAQRYGFKMTGVDYDVYNIEAEGLGQTVIYSKDSLPELERRASLISSQEDLWKVRTPDFDSVGRFTTILQAQALFQKMSGLVPSLQFCAPFSLAASLRGVEAFITDIYTNPGFAGGLLEAVVEEVLIPWIGYQKRQFPTATSIAGADALASLPLVNLNILSQWVIPAILRLREACGAEVNVSNWWGESWLKQPEQMLALKIRVCPHLLKAQDPDLEKLGAGFYQAIAAKYDVPLVLGLGAGYLARSTPEQVRQRVRQIIREAGENGRLALYLCSLNAATPRQNIMAAVEAASVGRGE